MILCGQVSLKRNNEVGFIRKNTLIRVEPVLDYSVRGLCVKSYGAKPNGKFSHPKGCPNFGERILCPPQALKFPDIIDMNQPIYLIYNRFEFGEHVKKMKEKHPDWSQRQCKCCLYWQGTARKHLKSKINDFLCGFPGCIVLTCPEATGVNVTATMKNATGIELEWPPVKYVYQVAIVGYPIFEGYFKPNWVSPPSATIKDILDEKGMSLEEFTSKFTLTGRDAFGLIRDDKPITPRIAGELSNAVGGSKEFWLRRDMQYRMGLMLKEMMKGSEV